MPAYNDRMETAKKTPLRRIAILPTLFTLGNAACGFVSILFAARASVAASVPEEVAYYVSGWLIMAAMVFDVFDGYIARRAKVASQFGAELDSLCDAISFGVAPAFLVIQLGGNFEGRLARDSFLGVALLYVVCAILRLARFNVQTSLDTKSHKTFRGLPSPAAAGCLASLILLRYNFANPLTAPDAIVNPLIHWLTPLCTLVVALLMVSRVPYVHVGVRVLHRRQTFSRLMQLILIVFMLALFREMVLVFLFWGYAMIGPVRVLLRQSATATNDPPQRSDDPHEPR